ncbi:hypothetical protein N431DRAFT_77236 [Stipitochalara longipes BDJ]|nr:hypothetical protein N431DRAFT_77236 [Stipitochalara longipes BDJ]
MENVRGFEVSFSINFPSQIYFNWNYDRLCFPDPFALWESDYITDSRPYIEFVKKCREREPRYLAMNIHGSWERDRGEEDPQDASYLEYIPLTTNFEEVVIFKDSRVRLSTLGALEFVDLLPEEKGLKMTIAEEALAEKMVVDREQKSLSTDTIPLIRTCKVILKSRAAMTRH